MARWLSWLERRPVTAEVVGSIPIRVAIGHKEWPVYGRIPYDIGNSCTDFPQKFYKDNYHAGVAELADAQDLKSCGTNLPYRFDSGRRHTQISDLIPLLLRD